MLPEDLHSRQRRLPEVGERGQDRIERAHAEVQGTDGAVTEAQYLARAGIGSLSLSPGQSATPFKHKRAFRFDAPRRVGSGAWRALRTLRAILEGGPG